MQRLILASGASLTADERRLLRFADRMGIPATSIPIEHGPALTGRGCLAMSAETLARAHTGAPRHLDHLVRQRCRTLLVFGCADSDRHAAALAWLTGNEIQGLSSHAGGRQPQSVFDLPRSGRELSRELAGLTFSTGRRPAPPTFDRAGDSTSDAIMLAGGRPVFLRTRAAECEVFLLAGAEVPDIDAPVSPATGLEAHYDRLIPLLIHLRQSFGERCWHGPKRTARLIIDDPLLIERYGFLDYRSLLSSMRRLGYGTSIAFIPWNYRRTSSRTASTLFGPRPDLSLCVHGCDHTDKEFEATDPGLLHGKARLALERMERHRARTGLAFEPVMVFPQGRFSSDALRALRDTNYLAAVNSTCFPTAGEDGRLSIADLLRPAITRFHGFPIFHRRYPRRLVDTAFDLFLGKPALLVEHHQYFRDGCESLEEFVTGVQDLEPALTWPTLASQLTRCCLVRAVSPHDLEVQFFTRRFRLENPDVERRRFRLLKHEPDVSRIRAVVVDGLSVPFARKDGGIEVELEVDPGQARAIEVLDHPGPTRGAPRMGLSYRAGVFVRRALSEFRDNTLARHPRLLRAAVRVTRRRRVVAADRHGDP